MKIKRNNASRLIDSIREIAAGADSDPSAAILKIRDKLREAGIPDLKQCDGEAHRNPYIDHCGLCAPRWGWIGAEIKVT